MKVVSLGTAQKLANAGYRGPTILFWDRYNPNIGKEGPQVAWRLVPSKRSFDATCCLAAPTRLKGLLLLIVYKIGIKR